MQVRFWQDSLFRTEYQAFMSRGQLRELTLPGSSQVRAQRFSEFMQRNPHNHLTLGRDIEAPLGYAHAKLGHRQVAGISYHDAAKKMITAIQNADTSLLAGDRLNRRIAELEGAAPTISPANPDDRLRELLSHYNISQLHDLFGQGDRAVLPLRMPLWNAETDTEEQTLVSFTLMERGWEQFKVDISTREYKNLQSLGECGVSVDEFLTNLMSDEDGLFIEKDKVIAPVELEHCDMGRGVVYTQRPELVESLIAEMTDKFPQIQDSTMIGPLYDLVMAVREENVGHMQEWRLKDKRHWLLFDMYNGESDLEMLIQLEQQNDQQPGMIIPNPALITRWSASEYF